MWIRVPELKIGLQCCCLSSFPVLILSILQSRHPVPQKQVLYIFASDLWYLVLFSQTALEFLSRGPLPSISSQPNHNELFFQHFRSVSREFPQYWFRNNVQITVCYPRFSKWLRELSSCIATPSETYVYTYDSSHGIASVWLSFVWEAFSYRCKLLTRTSIL